MLSHAQADDTCIRQKALKNGKTLLRLERVWFRNQSPELLPQSNECLDSLIAEVQRFTDYEWEIKVFFLPINKDNIDLSTRRAEALQSYLGTKGLQSGCFHPRPMGQYQRLNLEYHSLNSPRQFARVEFIGRRGPCD